MTFTSSYIISMVYLLIYCGPAQPEVSIRVSPDRCQFFKGESISLSCEEEKNPVPGRNVRRQSSSSRNGPCGDEWGESKEGASCVIDDLYHHDSGVYWCQSPSGGVSRSINITISDVILESPVLPVPEGDKATFRCWLKDQATGKPSSDLPAGFYLNGSLIRTESTGQMTIHHVIKSDEGFYKCNISDLGESPESWMEVTNSCSSSNSTSESAEPPLITRNQLIIKILVATPYVISTFLYFSILRDRARAREAAANARRRRANDVIMQVAE